MKKVFAFMAIAATILAVSCKKNDPKPGPGPDPEDPEDPEYVMPITIDGDFSDWAKLDASKMVVAQSAEGATKEALKVVKVYADEFFVFVYFEWDKDQISYEPDVEHVPFHVYINGDNDFTTGGYADQWADAVAVSYYDLNGLRISQPKLRGIYIERRGSKTFKRIMR